MSIRLKLDGFDKLIEQINTSQRSIDSIADSCIRTSAKTMDDELKSKMSAAGVDRSLINRMPSPETERSANTFTARVGFKMGNYDPTNLSDGFKAVFLNYGTPKRTKHGKIVARNFIAKAKKSAKAKIKKQQEAALADMVKGLEE